MPTLNVFDTSYNSLLIAMAMSDKGVDGKIGESSWFIADRARNFLLESVQSNCWAYTTPCAVGATGSFPGS